jgi:hypothetical protein
MAGFVAGLDRGQATLLPECLEDYRRCARYAAYHAGTDPGRTAETTAADHVRYNWLIVADIFGMAIEGC